LREASLSGEAIQVMDDRPTILDAVNALGVGVRVSLQRVGDRFTQTIYGVRRNQIDPILRSVEDADYEGWPLCPPLQELRELTDGDGSRSILLLGSAAYGHWSASVRSVSFRKGNPNLEFDVAVRLHRAPAYLGFAFETLPEANWIDMQFDQPSGLAFAHREKHALVISAPLEEIETASRAPSDFLKAFSDQGDPNRRLFLPATPLPKQYPATYRWRYCIASALA
jgi:hypothetical protein